MNPIVEKELKEVLVFDIETSSSKDGERINIRTDFDKYVENAIVKWFGCYSYKTNKYYEFNGITQKQEIKEILSQHKTLVGFNNIAFDFPILKNNELLTRNYYRNLDAMLILGEDKYKPNFKMRANYMKVDLKPVVRNGKIYGKNSLLAMAVAFGLDTLKGDIDYEIFFKNSWNEKETEEIIQYLRADVKMTKLLFDKLIDFWILFIDWITEEQIKKWVWINSTIAGLTYAAVCKIKGVEVSYNNDEKEKDEMGGRAVIPIQEETNGAHYLDEVSKYPHLFSEFNLFSEVDITGRDQTLVQKLIDKKMLFHGNEVFKVRGYYAIRKHGKIEQNLITKLKTRFAIKKVLKQYYKTNERKIEVPEILKELIPNNELTDEVLQKLNGQEYAIKIFANSLYGIVRKNSFEQIYSPNAGYDCCWIGQQIHEYLHLKFEEKGWLVVGGFTDSWFVQAEGISEEEILKYANDCLDELKKYMPFPEETHRVGYERWIDNIIYSYDEKKGEYKKNNYAFISNNKVKIVGFPIMKDNATELSMLIFKKYLESEAIKKKSLKFEKSYIETLIKKELENDITLTAVNYRCNDSKSYKNIGQLQAQISEEYLDGFEGNIKIIKNKKCGRVGKGNKYCSIKEAKENNLRFEDLILDKVWNELEPFIIKEKTANINDWF